MSAHFECNITPVNDPELKIDWKFNGSPLPSSSRIKTISDFGFVMLDISSADSRDSGEYICTATNKFGSDTTRAVLQCEGSSGVLSDSLHPESMSKLRQLELGTQFKALFYLLSFPYLIISITRIIFWSQFFCLVFSFCLF